VIPDVLAGADIPGGGLGSDAQLWSDCEFLYAQGIRVIVSLEFPGASMKRICEALGIRWVNFPVPDFGTPPLDDSFISLVDMCLDACRGELPVCIHCRAGIGRTGMLLTCLYGRLTDVDAATAVAHVRSCRTAIESADQHHFVERFFSLRHGRSDEDSQDAVD